MLAEHSAARVQCLLYLTGRALESFIDVQKKLQSALDEIRCQEVDVTKYTNLVDAERQHNLGQRLMNLTLGEQKRHQDLSNALRTLQQPIDRMEEQFRIFRDDLVSGTRIEILQWLSSMPYIQHHNQAKKDVLSGSGSWFLNDDQLHHWQSSSSSSIMWLHGPPGTGKSKLV